MVWNIKDLQHQIAKISLDILIYFGISFLREEKLSFYVMQFGNKNSFKIGYFCLKDLVHCSVLHFKHRL